MGKEEKQAVDCLYFPGSPEFQALPVSWSIFHQLQGATYFKVLCCFVNHQERNTASKGEHLDVRDEQSMSQKWVVSSHPRSSSNHLCWPTCWMGKQAQGAEGILPSPDCQCLQSRCATPGHEALLSDGGPPAGGFSQAPTQSLRTGGPLGHQLTSALEAGE